MHHHRQGGSERAFLITIPLFHPIFTFGVTKIVSPGVLIRVSSPPGVIAIGTNPNSVLERFPSMQRNFAGGVWERRLGVYMAFPGSCKLRGCNTTFGDHSNFNGVTSSDMYAGGGWGVCSTIPVHPPLARSIATTGEDHPRQSSPSSPIEACHPGIPPH